MVSYDPPGRCKGLSRYKPRLWRSGRMTLDMEEGRRSADPVVEMVRGHNDEEDRRKTSLEVFWTALPSALCPSRKSSQSYSWPTRRGGWNIVFFLGSCEFSGKAISNKAFDTHICAKTGTLQQTRQGSVLAFIWLMEGKESSIKKYEASCTLFVFIKCAE